ncbi:hypothetical protein [uncultured Methylobacterium sp.]|uniref:hypothetical protein n=1 Tax=uncultured Methylobacterium sp. TaxID=157278 RepID=UPI0035CA7F6D
MPGCRKLDLSSSPPAARGRVELATYVRRRARPPRACNDNRGPALRWPWALLIGAGPALALVAALSTLL